MSRMEGATSKNICFTKKKEEREGNVEDDVLLNAQTRIHREVIKRTMAEIKCYIVKDRCCLCCF